MAQKRNSLQLLAITCTNPTSILLNFKSQTTKESMLCDYTEFWSGWESVVPVARKGNLGDRWGRIRTDGPYPDTLAPSKTSWSQEDNFSLTLCHRATHTPGLGLRKAKKGGCGNWTSFGLTSAPYQPEEPAGQCQWLVSPPWPSQQHGYCFISAFRILSKFLLWSNLNLESWEKQF